MYKTEVLVTCKYILFFAERLCFLSTKFVTYTCQLVTSRLYIVNQASNASS